MSIPKSVVKLNRDGVTYTSDIDRCSYTITELSRAALRDVGKFVCNRARQNISSAGIKRRSGRMSKSVQYWVRKRETDLVVGFKKSGFYGGFQELGTSNQPKVGALQHAVTENIDQIRDIEAQYLSHIEDERRALTEIDEGDYEGDGT